MRCEAFPRILWSTKNQQSGSFKLVLFRRTREWRGCREGRGGMCQYSVDEPDEESEGLKDDVATRCSKLGLGVGEEGRVRLGLGNGG
jgi:hypothetical protein